MKILKSILVLALLNFSVLSVAQTSKTDAEKALTILKDGNKRFVEGKCEYPNLDKKRRTETNENGQHPFATIIGCSDSRVPVEQVFDVGIGDVFIIRVAGNIVDTDEAGSIEYGVEHLHTPLFVVLGHTSCGAVTAVTKGIEVHGNIPKLIDNIEPAVELAKKEHGDEFSEKLLSSAIENNVWQSIEDLLKVSSISAHLVKEGKLKIVGAVYHLDDGHVEWLGQHPNQTELLK